MTAAPASGETAAMERLLAWLGELGPRWGLPADACRVHGWLYLSARAATEAEIGAATRVGPDETRSALDWLSDHGLADKDRDDRWRTGDDPWELVMRSLERRRDRELGPALEILEASRQDARSSPRLAERIDRLRALAEDIAAIDAQARRLSSKSLRRLIGAGGRAARLADRLLGPSRGTAR